MYIAWNSINAKDDGIESKESEIYIYFFFRFIFVTLLLYDFPLKSKKFLYDRINNSIVFYEKLKQKSRYTRICLLTSKTLFLFFRVNIFIYNQSEHIKTSVCFLINSCKCCFNKKHIFYLNNKKLFLTKILLKQKHELM